MIAAEEAEAIARARAKEKKWGLMEPIEVRELRNRSGLRAYEVVSDPSKRGTKARFTIDAITGLILEEGYVSY